MDKLQHIDDLLKQSADAIDISSVGESDWRVVEKKLRYRKNRFYALWFFLTLISVSVATYMVIDTDPTKQVVNNELNTKETQPKDEQDPILVDEDISTVQRVPEIGNLGLKLKERHLVGRVNQDASPSYEFITPALPVEDLTQAHIDQDLIDKVTKKETKDNIKDELSPSVGGDTTSNIKIAKDDGRTKLDISKSVQNSADSSASNNNNRKKNIGRNGYWETGVAYTPNISGKLTSVNENLKGLLNRDYNDIASSMESASFSSTYGVKASYHFGNNLFDKVPIFIETGLYHTERAEYVAYDYVITSLINVVDDSYITYGNLMPSDFVEVKHQGSNSYHFVEIPVSIGTKIELLPNFDIRPQLGVSYMHMINRQGVKANFTYLELDNLADVDYVRNGNIASNLKVNLAYTVFEKVVLGVEPMASLNLTSINNEKSAIKVKPYAYGLTLNAAYKFNKQ